MPRLKGFRFPREIIAYAVWAYHRFALSTADVEDLPAERGVIVSREAIHLWVNRFGAHFASCIRRDRPRPNDRWHLDEVVIVINGVKHWLWRAVDANGDTLDILVQMRRNAKAAKRFLKRLIAQFGHPRVAITDNIQSRSRCSLPGQTTGPIRGSTIGLRAVTGPLEGARKSWAGSSQPDRHSVSLPPMTKSTPSSSPAAIISLPYLIAMHERMPSRYGTTTPAK